MGVSLPFQPFSSGEQRLFSIHGPSEETLCMLAPLYSPGCEDRYEEAAGQCPEGFVFPWSGLPQGEPLVPLHIGPGRLKGLSPCLQLNGSSSKSSQVQNSCRGSPGWLSGCASAFGSGSDPRVLGSSPTSGSLQGAYLSFCLGLCLS